MSLRHFWGSGWNLSLPNIWWVEGCSAETDRSSGGWCFTITPLPIPSLALWSCFKHWKSSFSPSFTSFVLPSLRFFNTYNTYHSWLERPCCWTYLEQKNNCICGSGPDQMSSPDGLKHFPEATWFTLIKWKILNLRRGPEYFWGCAFLWWSSRNRAFTFDSC